MLEKKHRADSCQSTGDERRGNQNRIICQNGEGIQKKRGNENLSRYMKKRTEDAGDPEGFSQKEFFDLKFYFYEKLSNEYRVFYVNNEILTISKN